MKRENRCEICNEKKEDNFIRMALKGSWSVKDVCLSCLKRLLENETDGTIIQ